MQNLSNMLTKIKNGQAINLQLIEHTNNIFCKKILDVLIIEGFIRGYQKKNQNKLNILLKYSKGVGVIKNIKQVSTPSQKVFISYFNLLKLKEFKYKVIILSTTQGILSDKEALNFKIGGIILFILY